MQRQKKILWLFCLIFFFLACQQQERIFIRYTKCHKEIVNWQKNLQVEDSVDLNKLQVEKEKNDYPFEALLAVIRYQDHFVHFHIKYFGTDSVSEVYHGYASVRQNSVIDTLFVQFIVKDFKFKWQEVSTY